MQDRLDRDIAQIVEENGMSDVIAALARLANDKKMSVLFNKLNKIYEWMITRRAK